MLSSVEQADAQGFGIETRGRSRDEVLRLIGQRRRWVEFCKQVGLTVPLGAQTPSIKELQTSFRTALDEILTARGIIERAMLNIPEEAGMTCSGWVVVTSIFYRKGEGFVTVRDARNRIHECHTLDVIECVSDIRPPR